MVMRIPLLSPGIPSFSHRAGEEEAGTEEGKGSGARQESEREATDRKREAERRGKEERIYLRIAADIMLICERGCMPDKPPVCA